MTTIAFVHAAATLVLTGIVWVVQLVVYPAFRLVPRRAWTTYHEEHSRRITAVLALPWPTQLLSLAVLLAMPSGVDRALLALDALLVVVPIAATAGAVRAHRGLRDPQGDPDGLRRLLALNLVRGLSWTFGSVTALLIAAQSLIATQAG